MELIRKTAWLLFINSFYIPNVTCWLRFFRLILIFYQKCFSCSKKHIKQKKISIEILYVQCYNKHNRRFDVCLINFYVHIIACTVFLHCKGRKREKQHLNFQFRLFCFSDWIFHAFAHFLTMLTWKKADDNIASDGLLLTNYDGTAALIRCFGCILDNMRLRKND